MKIDTETQLIIKKGNEYLIGAKFMPKDQEKDLRWSISAWDAWKTRDRENAERVARAVGGEIWLFNPIAGQIRKAV